MSSGAHGSDPAVRNRLIPPRVLLQHAADPSFKISPDGKLLAFFRRSNSGTDNIWVRNLHDNKMEIITKDVPGIEEFYWAFDGQHLLFYSDLTGNEDRHLFSVDFRSKVVRDLTPFPGARSDTLILNPSRPKEVLVTLNVRDKRLFDVYRVNLDSGIAALDTDNPGDVIGWTADQDLVVRAATAFRPKDAATVVRVRASAADSWRDLLTVPFEEATTLGQVNGGSIAIGFSRGGKTLNVVSSLGSPTAQLVELDVDTGREIRTVSSDPKSDIFQDLYRFIFLTHPVTGEVEAVPFNFFKPTWHVVDDKVKRDFEFLEHAHAGVLLIDNRSLSESRWIVRYLSDIHPPKIFLYERANRSLNLLTESASELANYRFAAMQAFEIPMRDGLELVSYLTLPPGRSTQNLPLVMLVHGGPGFRDDWGFSPLVQFLANRGYAVLQTQYRGSEGFGKAVLNAGNLQMGRGTDNDIVDGIAWAVQKKIADPKRVAVMGYSFGGYHTLRAITTHPELYACAVDIVGVSDLGRSYQDIPEYWQPVLERHWRRIGQVVQDRALNEELSPLYHIDRIRAPLLIAHGSNDARVNVQESERIVNALREFGREVTFVLYPDEGHFIGKLDNEVDLFQRIESFFHQHLGGEIGPPSAGRNADGP